MEYRIASIGTLPAHPLWEEQGAPRTGHATTTVIKSGGNTLLVDPSLPAQILDARLHERWGMRVSDVTHIFLTSFDPDRRRALDGFADATWYMHEPEIECARAFLLDELQRADGDQELVLLIEHQLQQLSNFKVPEDQVMKGVDLFPLPGYTPGCCGLLLPTPKRTIVITGDTAATIEHIEKYQVLANCANIEEAQESLKVCIEIADIIIPGRDNIVLNPLRA